MDPKRMVLTDGSPPPVLIRGPHPGGLHRWGCGPRPRGSDRDFMTALNKNLQARRPLPPPQTTSLFSHMTDPTQHIGAPSYSPGATDIRGLYFNCAFSIRNPRGQHVLPLPPFPSGCPAPPLIGVRPAAVAPHPVAGQAHLQRDQQAQQEARVRRGGGGVSQGHQAVGSGGAIFSSLLFVHRVYYSYCILFLELTAFIFRSHCGGESPLRHGVSNLCVTRHDCLICENRGPVVTGGVPPPLSRWQSDGMSGPQAKSGTTCDLR